jgi:hypothetical protein
VTAAAVAVFAGGFPVFCLILGAVIRRLQGKRVLP